MTTKDPAVLVRLSQVAEPHRTEIETALRMKAERARAMRDIARPQGKPITMTPAAPSEAEAYSGAMTRVDEKPKPPTAHKATKVGPEVVAADPPEVGLTDSLDTEGRVHFGEIEEVPRPERKAY
jgi:hypothetical protein